jgi:hypothetical protein
MGFFKYPYTDLNELNLDWVIAKIKYIEQASHIIFDNSGTPLVSNNVQDVIEELYNMISTQGVTTWNGRSGVVVPEAHDYTGAQVDYDNTISGLTATETQSAIDELAARPLGGVESFNTRTGTVVPAAGDYSAADVTYDNTGSGLTATDSQSAIDEVNNKIPATIVESFNSRTGAVAPAAGDYDAADITYDNTTSGLTATDAQAAIDELDDRLDNFSVTAAQVSYDNTLSGLTATDAQAALDEIANDVLSSGVASFNGRTGAVNPAANDYDLTMLGDVAISSPAADDVLKYDSVSQKWVNGAGGGGGGGSAATTTYDNTASGLTATNVQDAIDEVVSEKMDKTDATPIVATGSTNNSGATIVDGSLFWLNGQLCKAIGNIAMGATFTLNTNYTTGQLAPKVLTYTGGTTANGNLLINPLSANDVPIVVKHNANGWAAVFYNNGGYWQVHFFSPDASHQVYANATGITVTVYYY